ncbi:MAG: BrnT family toxin [Sulfuricaulis sp.]
MAKARFDWDEKKNHENQKKHGVSFGLAQLAFTDSKRVIAEDPTTAKVKSGITVLAGWGMES